MAIQPIAEDNMPAPFGQFGDICKMIKIEHSVFALPYAWAGAFLAAKGLPSWQALFFLTCAMIAARSFAMTYNRIADMRLDEENPRTKNRPLVTGAITKSQAWIFTIFMAAVFIIACAFLNNLCFVLSIPALLFSAIYSYLKRFTPLCHFWLGATLGLAPLAGWLAVNPDYLGIASLTLALAVTFWVGAFDIYYAFADMEFDTQKGLYSVPARYGAKTALVLAAFSHVITVIFLFITGVAAGLGWPWYAFCVIIGIILYFENRMLAPDDLRNLNTVFFTMNGFVSPLALLGIILGIYF